MPSNVDRLPPLWYSQGKMKPAKKKPLVAFLTDFGLDDPYVGIMKGVIHGISPDAAVVDVTHAVQPQNITQASFLLYASYRQFPENTVFVCVVDPGVGTERRPVLVRIPGYVFIGPDNGLFGFLNAVPGKSVVHLTNPAFFLPAVGQTFHGRDIFAPVAAHWTAKGEALLDGLGPRLPELVEFPGRFPDSKGNTITGKIMHVDRFGNLITNIRENDLRKFSFDPSGDTVTCGDTALFFASTFSDVPENAAGTLLGSSGHLEIFVRNGNAEKTLNTAIGDPIYVRKHHG